MKCSISLFSECNYLLKNNEPIISIIHAIIGYWKLHVKSKYIYIEYNNLLCRYREENLKLTEDCLELRDKEQSELILIVGTIVCILFVFKNIYLLIINFIAHKFIYNKYKDLSIRLLKKYLYMNYDYNVPYKLLHIC